MASLRYRLGELSENIAVAVQAMSVPVAAAATAAIRRAGESLKTNARTAIARNGFSARWQNTFRVTFYPAQGNSIDAAAFAYHRIPYAGVFDEPTRILGKPLLWIPLSDAVKLPKGRRSPRYLASQGVPMFAINRPGRPPLLAAKTRAANRPVSVSSLRGKGQSKRPLRTVPLFVGLSEVHQKKRFGVATLANAERARLRDYYNAALKV